MDCSGCFCRTFNQQFRSGWFGRKRNQQLLFGLVGLVCYPLPIFLFLGVAFVIANKRNPRAYRKMAGFVLLFLAVCLFLQLVTEGAVYERDFMAYYRVSAEYKTGGGLLGGALSRLLVQAFGTVGTYVITVIAMVISFVLITQKSMFDMIKKFSRKMYRRAAERKALRQEELKARQEEQAEKEQQQERRKKRKERTEDFLKETEVNEPEQEIKRKKNQRLQGKKRKSRKYQEISFWMSLLFRKMLFQYIEQRNWYRIWKKLYLHRKKKRKPLKKSPFFQSGN